MFLTVHMCVMESDTGEKMKLHNKVGSTIQNKENCEICNGVFKCQDRRR